MKPAAANHRASWHLGAFPALWLVLATPGCTVVNSIDVCERDGAEEHEVNRRHEGEQAVVAGQGIAPLPSGAALITFVSESPRTAGHKELRGVVVDQDGRPTRTCESPDDDHTFAQPDESLDDPVQVFSNPAVIGPTSANESGILVYMRWVGEEIGPGASGQADLLMTGLGASGCDEGEPRLVASAEPNDLLAGPSVASLGGGDYLIVWSTLSTVDLTSTVRGRIARPGDATEPWLGTVVPTTGERNPRGDAVDILPPGSGTFAVSAIRTSDAVLVANFARTSTALHVDLTVLSERLELRRPTTRLAELDDPTFPQFVTLQLAYDGERALLVFNERIGGRGSRVRAAVLAPDGSVEREPFTIDPSGDADQERPAVVARPGGGFVVGWEVAGSEGDADRLGTAIHAVLLDSQGETQFANRACAQRPFRLNLADEGDQRALNLAVRGDGALLASWTDLGRNGSDISSASVRAAVWQPRDLAPIR